MLKALLPILVESFSKRNLIQSKTTAAAGVTAVAGLSFAPYANEYEMAAQIVTVLASSLLFLINDRKNDASS